MEGLSFDNILGEQEVDTLFMDPEDELSGNAGNTAAEEAPEEKAAEELAAGKERNIDTTTTEVNPADLFEDESEEQPESVGSEKVAEGKGDSSTDDGGGASPNNFYSSIANAMAEDGIFPNLDEDVLKKVTDAESLSDAIEAEVNARFDEKQQRIIKALENGVEPTEIGNYERTINYIASIKDADLEDESEKGEKLRSQLIYQDLINRGYTDEQAQRRTKKSIDSGNDIEYAKEALQSNMEFFQNRYNALLKEAQETAEKERANRQKQVDKMKDSLLKDKTLMGDMEISQDMRKKAFESITKPVYRDPETGDYFTAVQKYEREHHADFFKYVGLFYTLTNGFTDFKSFVKGEVRKETKKGLRELEKTLNNTSRTSNGNLKLVTNAREDPESYFRDFKLDL